MTGLFDRIVKHSKFVKYRVVVFFQKFEMFESSLGLADTRGKETTLSKLFVGELCACEIKDILTNFQELIVDENKAWVVADISVIVVSCCAAQLVLQKAIFERLFLKSIFQALRFLKQQ